LKGYDYSQKGLYFITICVQDRLNLFGKITDGKMHLSDGGKMVSDQWQELLNRFTNIALHEYVVMPNHFHGILEITGQSQNIGQSSQSSQSPKKLGDILGAFQSITTVCYIRGVKNNHWPEFHGQLWQRNYWEHIIRDQQAYDMSRYIENNPRKWQEDQLHIDNDNDEVRELPEFYGDLPL